MISCVKANHGGLRGAHIRMTDGEIFVPQEQMKKLAEAFAAVASGKEHAQVSEPCICAGCEVPTKIVRP